MDNQCILIYPVLADEADERSLYRREKARPGDFQGQLEMTCAIGFTRSRGVEASPIIKRNKTNMRAELRDLTA